MATTMAPTGTASSISQPVVHQPTASGGGPPKGDPPDAGKDFLKTEYTQCIDLVKYYDGRHIDLLKFASGLSAAVPTVVFSFFKLSDAAALGIWNFVTFIALVTAISLLAIFASMVQNRVYFIPPARQANGIRVKLFPSGNDVKNLMYTSTSVPVLDIFSTQTTQMIFVAFQTAVFFGLADYSNRHSVVPSPSLTDSAWLTVKVAGGLMVLAFAYLWFRGRQTADDSINAGIRLRRAKTA